MHATVFGLEREYAYIVFWSAMAFPIWHVLVSTAVFINIVCMWFLMLSVRYWYTNKLISLVFFFTSSTTFFLFFSLAIGFVACDYFLSVRRDNWLRKSGTMLRFFFGYFSWICCHDIHREREWANRGNYNIITIDNLLEYVPDLMAYCLAVAGGGYALSFRISDSGERERLIRIALGISVLLFFAIFPYSAVGQAHAVFCVRQLHGPPHHAFGHSPGHAAGRLGSLRPPLGFRKKIAVFLACLVLVAQVVILHQGYSHKGSGAGVQGHVDRRLQGDGSALVRLCGH